MKSHFSEKMKFSGIETQLADCAVCMLHTYIAHEDLQKDFQNNPHKQVEILTPYVDAYLKGQEEKLRTIGKDIPKYDEMLAAFSGTILMMYAHEDNFKKTVDKISVHDKQRDKWFPDVEQARILFVQYAKMFCKTRIKGV